MIKRKEKKKMEILEKFVYLPSEEIKRGIRVYKDTHKTFRNTITKPYAQIIEQEIKDLKLITKVKSKMEEITTDSTVEQELHEGSIILFDEDVGYFPPRDRIGTIDDAMETLKAQKDMIEKSYKNNEEIDNES
jgi:hypothetical protein